jgi:Zn-dependent M28 family amino/carboxypeptidase
MKCVALSATAVLFIGAAPAAMDTPDAARLKASVETLVRFGTRHTMSSPTDPKRGIGAARAWAAAEFRRLGKACGGCITVDTPTKIMTGDRAPEGVTIVNIMGVQKGTGAANDVVIIAGHIDSRVTDVMDATHDAPGANDDASGVALTLESARILSKTKHRATLIYAILSGEEQGLFGGRLLAETAKARGWTVLGMLNNDIVGNTIGTDGTQVTDRVRVFSEGIRFAEDEKAQRGRRGNGGEDDGPSRALAKAVQRVAARGPSFGVTPFLVRRPDRFSRGGDHLPLLEAGYPAIRFSVGVENYDAQHQDLRTVDGKTYGDTVERMNFAYLARVTALNIAVARELANAPAAPSQVTLFGALSSDTKVSWPAVPDAAGYRLYWRRADRTDWEKSVEITVPATEYVLKGVVVDDHFFGVSSVSASKAESIVTFGGSAPRN